MRYTHCLLGLRGGTLQCLQTSLTILASVGAPCVIHIANLAYVGAPCVIHIANLACVGASCVIHIAYLRGDIMYSKLRFTILASMVAPYALYKLLTLSARGTMRYTLCLPCLHEGA